MLPKSNAEQPPYLPVQRIIEITISHNIISKQDRPNESIKGRKSTDHERIFFHFSLYISLSRYIHQSIYV